jgi:hypothetical protein
MSTTVYLTRCLFFSTAFLAETVCQPSDTRGEQVAYSRQRLESEIISDFHMQKEMRRAAAKRVGENTVFPRGDYEFMPLFCITQD